jgi:hypothetical protein
VKYLLIVGDPGVTPHLSLFQQEDYVLNLKTKKSIPVTLAVGLHIDPPSHFRNQTCGSDLTSLLVGRSGVLEFCPKFCDLDCLLSSS